VHQHCFNTHIKAHHKNLSFTKTGCLDEATHRAPRGMTLPFFNTKNQTTKTVIPCVMQCIRASRDLIYSAAALLQYTKNQTATALIKEA
jgi:hypothetical protein